MANRQPKLDDKSSGLIINDSYLIKTPPILVTDAYAKNATTIMPMLKEMEANAIVGRMTIDNFYKEYDALKKQGLIDIID